jgi:hypothetical protein
VRGTLVAVVFLLNVASLIGWQAERAGEDWRSAAAAVAGLPLPRENTRRLIVFNANDGRLPFDYYYRRLGGPRSDEIETGTPADFFAIDPPRTMRRVLDDADVQSLRQLLSDPSVAEVVLVSAHSSWADPDGRTESLLTDQLMLADEWKFTDIRLLRFTRR